MKKRKIPLRKCIVTNEMKPKQELIRIVRSPEGEVSVDPSGKKNGRGAYITNSDECFELAKKKDVLSRHLQVHVDSDVYDQLQLASKKGRK
ncbi:RNase P modulator RnpM [Halalkalibacter hemicellulosilyticus]|uniref:Nucleic-acid-binding protein n=1 Tax=Halalkalibacter hemicellulosilyticusJCM 9152 TaxID=1236971 RepID=W4QC75_9BACI|nr:YlxR family protein [Halalkalibacter hemicellulosilyticus]GAE29288.1 nucleic-acid-binding protein [Halalkalibacter hemicellulosilyticusJCM 9152]